MIAYYLTFNSDRRETLGNVGAVLTAFQFNLANTGYNIIRKAFPPFLGVSFQHSNSSTSFSILFKLVPVIFMQCTLFSQVHAGRRLTAPRSHCGAFP
jgi:hypothetical protein